MGVFSKGVGVLDEETIAAANVIVTSSTKAQTTTCATTEVTSATTKAITVVPSCTEATTVEITRETSSTAKSTTALTTKLQTSRSISGKNLKYLGNFKLTAYCPCSQCCGKWANGITATGVIAQPNHTIAVDPSVIPYGSKVKINGRTYVAEDCGGAIKSNRIDIYFSSHQEACDFGVQYADVYLVVD